MDNNSNLLIGETKNFKLTEIARFLLPFKSKKPLPVKETAFFL